MYSAGTMRSKNFRNITPVKPFKWFLRIILPRRCLDNDTRQHWLRTPGQENTLTAWPKIKSQSQIYRYSRSIFCLPHRPKILGFFDLYLHWVSVARARQHWNIYRPWDDQGIKQDHSVKFRTFKDVRFHKWKFDCKLFFVTAAFSSSTQGQ